MVGSRLSPKIFQKEGNVLFNNVLNTFHMWLFDIEPMVKEYSDNERKNIFYINYSTDRIVHTAAFVILTVEH